MSIPTVEELTVPITIHLIVSIRSQGNIGLTDLQLMQKKPADLNFSVRQNWAQILAKTQKAIHEDDHYGRFYRKYEIDEGFIEATFPEPLVMTPGRWAANVREALETPSPGTGVV
jgi:hypothetical protein